MQESIDRIPRILPCDLPPEALERLAMAVNYPFPPRDATQEKRAQIFLEALNAERHGWGGNYLNGKVEHLEHPTAVQRLDLIGNPTEASKQKRDESFNVFLLVSPGIAFSLRLEVQGSSIRLMNLEAHPGVHYDTLVQLSKRAHLTRSMEALYEDVMKGSTPVHYDDFLFALDALAEKHPQMASGRDARKMSEACQEERRAPARSVIPRGRAS